MPINWKEYRHPDTFEMAWHLVLESPKGGDIEHGGDRFEYFLKCLAMTRDHPKQRLAGIGWKLKVVGESTYMVRRLKPSNKPPVVRKCKIWRVYLPPKRLLWLAHQDDETFEDIFRRPITEEELKWLVEQLETVKGKPTELKQVAWNPFPGGDRGPVGAKIRHEKAGGDKWTWVPVEPQT